MLDYFIHVKTPKQPYLTVCILLEIGDVDTNGILFQFMRRLLILSQITNCKIYLKNNTPLSSKQT
jgi:hypothetical protein